MSDKVEDLNYDFNYNLFIAKTLLNNLAKHEDKTRATRWMKKLSTCNRTLNEIKLRNDFMYYLIVNIQNGELQPPFNENPPQKPLPSIAHLLPGGAEAEARDEAAAFEKMEETTAGRKPMLYENSPDGGAFLAAQPIPRCGAFCYLAVVARKPEAD
ncbi:uncharacterized protein LOC103313929 [Tribolium castaneum]|uniref:DUF4485 domain-containing protein n=1 Tax=Tribolium castaneum TaxID=7070 RepID=D6WW03_TRICA|nr:PREDICTED: uncharacterized protein LOC103313929 [Tribolium castaneum]EFA08209.1 hypothetical protein TcasGA2_TC005836 [Tribolium castaneum]|eukprot:XP_008196687.1 PREDICTED: uncharacterized protein LOC103313929 [Tribolium castaneum]